MNTRDLRILKLAGFYLLITLFVACGYTFQGGGSVLPPDVKKVYVPLVENNTTYSNLTTLVTESLRDRFEQFGVLMVVENDGDADAILSARINKVSKTARTVTSRTDTALQYDLVLDLGAELRRLDGQVLWRNQALRVNRAYGATSGSVVRSSADFAGGLISSSDLGSLNNRELARGQEQEAFNALADDVAKKIYDDAVAPDF